MHTNCKAAFNIRSLIQFNLGDGTEKPFNSTTKLKQPNRFKLGLSLRQDHIQNFAALGTHFFMPLTPTGFLLLPISWYKIP